MMKRIIPMILVLAMLVSVLPITASAANGTSRGDAIPVSFDEAYAHTWTADNDDKNHYISFTVPSRGLIAIACTYPVDDGGDYGDMAFAIYNQSGTCVWKTVTDYETPVEGMAVLYTGLNAGKYYMNITPRFTVVSGEFPIVYALTHAAADDTHGTEAEPNNDKAMADTLTVGKEFVGSSGEGGVMETAIDYWKYNNTTNAVGYRVYLPELEEFRKQGQIFHEDSTGNITDIDLIKDVRQTEDGVYYFDVKSAKGINYLQLKNNGCIIVPYTLWIEPFKNEPLTITKQPESAGLAINQRVTVGVEASGELLSYAWYVKNYGETEFTQTSTYEKTYHTVVNDDNCYQQLYCVITDAYGNTVKSDTIFLYILTIVKQPEHTAAEIGEKAVVQVEALGDGLTYQWYTKNKADTTFALDPNATGNSYSFTMDAAQSGKKMYCIITDRFGNTVQSNTVDAGIPDEVYTLGTCGENVTWVLTYDGVLRISGTGPMADYTSTNATPWYWGNVRIKSIVVEEGITAIGATAFGACKNVVSVELPTTLKSIGRSAFFTCTSLTTIIIPEGVTTIGERAFIYSGIQRIVIPASITSIGNSAFQSCDDLRTVYYGGTDRSAITIGTNNDDLLAATWRYGYDGGELFIPGDLDGDGEISDWDGVLLARYLAGWNVEIDLAAADVDGDGEVSDWDGVVLDRYLAGWNVTIG